MPISPGQHRDKLEAGQATAIRRRSVDGETGAADSRRSRPSLLTSQSKLADASRACWPMVEPQPAPWQDRSATAPGRAEAGWLQAPGATSAANGASARRALDRHVTDNAGTIFDVMLASIDALDRVRAKAGRVCLARMRPRLHVRAARLASRSSAMTATRSAPKTTCEDVAARSQVQADPPLGCAQ